MNPVELIDFLEKLISKNLNISTMIWGPPGIGKSSIVAAAAEKAGIDFIDLRLRQLAPTDLRGLPVPVHPNKGEEYGISKWYPPEFLPREGKGILFLDELNMAPPVMQGVAQQLILDRKIGNSKVKNQILKPAYKAYCDCLGTSIYSGDTISEATKTCGTYLKYEFKKGLSKFGYF